MESSNYWVSILSNLLEEIASKLDISDIGRMCLVCKRWNQDISGFSILWMKLTKEIVPEIQPIEGSSWKQTFQKAYSSYLGFWNFMTNHEFIHPSNKRSVSQNHGTITNEGLHVKNGEYYEVQPAKIFEAHLGMTVEVWFYPENFRFNEWDNSIVSMHGWGYGWELRGNANTALFLVTNFGGHQDCHVHLSNIIRINEWNHMAGIIHKTGNKVTLFVNGQSHSITLKNTKFVYGHNKMYFGRNVDWPERFFDGYIAAVRIVNRELTEAEFLVPNKQESEITN